MTVTISAQPRPMVLQIHAEKSASGVRRDGVLLRQVSSATDLDGHTEVWRSDTQSQSVLVKFDHPGGTTTIQL